MPNRLVWFSDRHDLAVQNGTAARSNPNPLELPKTAWFRWHTESNRLVIGTVQLCKMARSPGLTQTPLNRLALEMVQFGAQIVCFSRLGLVWVRFGFESFFYHNTWGWGVFKLTESLRASQALRKLSRNRFRSSFDDSSQSKR